MIFFKKKLRKEKFLQRKILTEDFIREQSELIIDQILLVCNMQSSKIAFYKATNGEIDPDLALRFLALKHEISLPIISISSQVLDFRIFQIGDKLVQNKIYSTLMEPSRNKKLTIFCLY